MDQSSGASFGQYTGTQVGKQVAFVRDGVVLAAPAIGAPLDGKSLQLSGELTAATAETIARMLREGS
jgi:preprotein translocase subunit SecD